MKTITDEVEDYVVQRLELAAQVASALMVDCAVVIVVCGGEGDDVRSRSIAARRMTLDGTVKALSDALDVAKNTQRVFRKKAESAANN